MCTEEVVIKISKQIYYEEKIQLQSYATASGTSGTSLKWCVMEPFRANREWKLRKQRPRKTLLRAADERCALGVVKNDTTTTAD